MHLVHAASSNLSNLYVMTFNEMLFKFQHSAAKHSDIQTAEHPVSILHIFSRQQSNIVSIEIENEFSSWRQKEVSLA
jgi:hypothetical protein